MFSLARFSNKKKYLEIPGFARESDYSNTNLKTETLSISIDFFPDLNLWAPNDPNFKVFYLRNLKCLICNITFQIFLPMARPPSICAQHPVLEKIVNNDIEVIITARGACERSRAPKKKSDSKTEIKIDNVFLEQL